MNLDGVGGMQESVCESGEPGSRQESVWESGKPGDRQESVCDSGESVQVLSLRALRARAGGDHVPDQLWTSVGTIWDPFGTSLEAIWDQFGSNLGPMLGPFGDKFGTTLESGTEHSTRGVHPQQKPVVA